MTSSYPSLQSVYSSTESTLELLRHTVNRVFKPHKIEGRVISHRDGKVRFSINTTLFYLFSRPGLIRPSGRWRLIVPSDNNHPPVVLRLEGRHTPRHSSYGGTRFELQYAEARWVLPPTNNVNDLKPVTPGKATIRTF